MRFFAHEFNDLKELFIEQLKDIYDAEYRLTYALPKMADAASSPELKSAIQQHLGETQEHHRKLEAMFRSLQMEPERETCDAIKGLIAEGDEMIDAKGDDQVRDAGLIAACQKVEHYEMATYGTLRTWAEQLGMHDCATTLESILMDEKNTDQKLTQIAESRVNVAAAQ